MSLPVLQLHLFGAFHLVYGTRLIVGVNTLRLQAILTFLVLHAGVPQSRQYLAFLLWPDTNESSARNNLRQFLHQLRQALPDPNRFLSTDANSVTWNLDPEQQIDIVEFARALHQAELLESRNDVGGMRRALERGVSLYGGHLLPSCYDDWIIPERDRLRSQCRNAYQKLVQVLEIQREYGTALQMAEQLVRHDPLDEETYQTLMRLNSLTGNTLAVRRIYQQAVQTFERELGAAPSGALAQTFERLQRALPVQDSSSATQLTLIGRKREWQQLRSAWTRTVNGDAHLVLITGEAGIGKSRLAQELFHWVGKQGITAAHSRSYEAEGRLSLAPVTDWLRSEMIRPHIAKLDKIWLSEITRLLPELLAERTDLPRPEPITEYGERQRFFEALARAVISAPHPLLLWMDDLQWCDPETFEWLHFLLRFETHTPLLIVGTARSEESPADHPLVTLVRQLRSDGKLSIIELSSLDAAETARLAAQIGGQELDASASVRLYRETEGNPLFVVETIRAGVSDETVAHANAEPFSPPQTDTLPPRVYAVIAGRLTKLSASARSVAALGAAIGRAFPIELLQRAGNENEENLFRALDELWQKRILHEQRPNLYDFTHDKLREVAYVEMSAPQRRLTHRRIAQALEELYADDPDAMTAQIAAQYEQAGQFAQAVPHYERAGILAAGVYANEDAINLLNRGLRLLKELPPGEKHDKQELGFLLWLAPLYRITKGWAAEDTERVANRARVLAMRVGTLMQRVQALWLQQTADVVGARFERVREANTELQRLLEEPGATYLPFIGIHFVGTRFFTGQFAQANALFEDMLAKHAESDRPDFRLSIGVNYLAHCLVWDAHALWFLGYPQQALERCEQGIRAAQEYAQPFNHALTITYLATLQEMRADPLTFQMQAEAAESLAREFQVRYYLAWATILLEFARATTQPNPENLTRLRDSIHAFKKTGARIRLPYYRSLLARAYHNAGRYGEAFSALDEAYAESQEHGESWWDAELHRLRGEFLLTQGGDAAQSEDEFRHALEISRAQRAKSPELRAAMSMARLWQANGNTTDALQLLAPLYAWFTEGFDTPDLQRAHALIAQLEAK